MFTIEEIVRATGGTVSGSGTESVDGVSTDSRTIQPGQLFVPLKGERFDGHDYIPVALGRGVRVFLAEQGKGVAVPEGTTRIAVADTLKALGDLAAFHRSRFSLPVVGVTGSNGKTTTKEMLSTILEQMGPGLKTSGNLNNLIGLPQMLFQLQSSHRWAVLEMGMSEPGEIDRLAEIAKPGAGIITNAFPAHLETMGTVEAVAMAKGELFRRLPKGGTAIYNADDALIAAQPSPAGVKRLSFGLRQGEITAIDITEEGTGGQGFTLVLPGERFPVRMKTFGIHNVANALAAAAAAYALGVDPRTIRAGLESFSPFSKRFVVEEVNGIVLIDDTYNANPASTEAALVTVRGMKRGHRAVAVLGDMLELGSGAEDAHATIGRVAASSVENLVVTGTFAAAVAEGARSAGLADENVVVAADHDAVLAILQKLLRQGDYVLVKGSRGMKMDVVTEALRKGAAPITREETN